MPLASVIMPVHDGIPLRELQVAAESIRAQTFTDFEFLILKDDIRRSDLLNWLDDFAAVDERVILLSNDSQQGIGYSLNRLVENSSGEFVVRMDADDISMPERLERQIAFLLQRTEIMFVGTYAYEIDSQDRIVHEKRMPLTSKGIEKCLATRDPFIHPSVIFRRQFFTRCGLYNAGRRYSYLEDTELWGRALRLRIPCANMPEFLFQHRGTSSLQLRRRGIRFAFWEWWARTRHVMGVGLPHYLPFPLAVAGLRISPVWVRSLAYRRLRRGVTSPNQPELQSAPPAILRSSELACRDQN